MPVTMAYRALRPTTDREKSPRKAARDQLVKDLIVKDLAAKDLAAKAKPPPPPLPHAPSKLQQLEAMVAAGRVDDPLAGAVQGESAGFRVHGLAPAPRNDSGDEAGRDQSLTGRVRALYEHSVVPVREIARLVGVSERTIYKYARRQGWTRRHLCIGRDDEVRLAGRTAKSGRARTPRTGLAGANCTRGAGGRFVRREEAGLAHARGLKALDPLAAAQAGESCAQAGALSDIAVAQALAESASRAADRRAAREAEANVRTLAHLTRAVRELTRLAIAEDEREETERAERAKAQAEAEAEARRVEQLRADLARKLQNMIASEQDREQREAEAAKARAEPRDPGHASAVVPAKAGTQ